MCSVKASFACSMCHRHCLRPSPATPHTGPSQPVTCAGPALPAMLSAGAGGRGGAAKTGAMFTSRAGLQKLAGVDGGEDAVNRAVAACIPVGHVGAKWDIAIAAVFLASPAARFISGPPPATPAGLASCALLRFRASLLQGLGSDVKKFPLNATLVSIAAYATGLMVAANAPGSHRREVVHDLEHVAFMRVTVHSA